MKKISLLKTRKAVTLIEVIIATLLIAGSAAALLGSVTFARRAGQTKLLHTQDACSFGLDLADELKSLVYDDAGLNAGNHLVPLPSTANGDCIARSGDPTQDDYSKCTLADYCSGAREYDVTTMADAPLGDRKEIDIRVTWIEPDEVPPEREQALSFIYFDPS